MANCQVELKDVKAARKALEDLGKLYPQSEAAAAARERLARLNELLESQQRDFNAGMVGRVLPVLFERAGRHPGQLVGRSPYLQAVHAPAPASAIGQVRNVEILSIGPNSLAAALAD